MGNYGGQEWKYGITILGYYIQGNVWEGVSEELVERKGGQKE